VLAKRRFPELAERDLGSEASPYSLSFPTNWIVDAHVRCHRLQADDDRNLQQFADAAAYRLTRLRDRLVTPLGSGDDVFDDIDSVTISTFEAGLYGVAIFFHERIRRARARRDESSEALTSYLHQLSAQAGLRGAQATALSIVVDDSIFRSPAALLQLASNRAQAGDIPGAATNLGAAKALLLEPRNRALREPLALDLLIRETQVVRSLEKAEQALAIASQLPSLYRQHTARVLLAMIALPSRPATSQAQFEAVLEDRGKASWIYLAECWFGLGYLALRARKIERAYRYLIAAQYIYGVLGLQPAGRDGLESPAQGHPHALPAHWLRAPAFTELSSERCAHLRKAAIAESEIQRHALFDLTGDSFRGRTPTLHWRVLDPVAA
jgi:hypothetical protein